MGMAPQWVMWPNLFVKIFIPISLKLSYELWFQIPQLFLQKTSFNLEISVTFDQVQRMALTFDTIQWPWKWGQGHQNLISSSAYHNDTSMQVWRKSKIHPLVH